MLVALLALFSAHAAVPTGWSIAGSDPAAYTGETVTEAHTGKGSARFASVKSRSDGFGTLMQMMSADNYAGQRVRMTAWVKSDAVADWAGLWMRVDGQTESSLSFDNMGDRPIKGTVGWKAYSIVLDVPAHASRISFGILVNGTGAVWMDDLAFESVEDSVPLTGSSQSKQFEPVNASFEK